MMIDTDVHNMARWGITFQDCDTWFNGEYSVTSDFTGKGNVWNYIDAFGLTNIQSYNWEQRFGGGDTPLFWALWNEYTVAEAYGDPYHPVPEVQGSPLMDWEWDLLASQPIWDKLNQEHNHIGTNILRQAL